MMQTLVLFDVDFDAATVFVTKNSLLVRLAQVTLIECSSSGEDVSVNAVVIQRN